MGLKIDTVAHACRLITREVKDAYKNLTIHYIVHHEGQRSEALALAAQELVQHPAAETAMHILQKPRSTEDSTLLGTAVARQNAFFGLATRDRLLALCTLNLDQFDSLKEARRFAYHLAWHAIDALEYHANPDNRSGAATEILIRRRNTLEVAYANLQADTFSAVISALHGDKDAIGRMALIRSNNALVARSLQSPEYFPFAIACDATRYSFEHANARQLAKKKLIPAALRIAKEVSMTFDQFSVEHWLAFSEPSQDMAWRGYGREEILCAAINTSPNTYVRATGYLVTEITGITPAPVLKISDAYSPFADDAFNSALHERVALQIFEDVIAQGLKQNSVVPFLKMASQQNESLTEGRMIGWCASALQQAAQAYESALANGSEPEAYIRKEFADERGRTSWEGIKKLSDEVVKSKRGGNIVTMSKLLELSENVAGINAIQRSIQQTLSDPVYQQKLDAARELTPTSPRLSGNTPKGADLRAQRAPATPAAAVQAGPKAPGLGGKQQTQQTTRGTKDTGEGKRA